MKTIFSLFTTAIFALTMNAQESQSVQLIEKLAPYVDSLESEFSLIDEERKKQLQELGDLIAETESRIVTFICTHNSRRSQLAEVWAATAAYYYQIPDFKSYSGGTEATAFNPRAVKALQRAGFNVKSKGDQNPTYRVYFTAEHAPQRCFSKKFSDNFNPQKDFIAVMVCSDADEACPFVDGAAARLAIPYVDPKVSDGTFLENQTYDERCRQIAREVFFAMHHAKSLLQEAQSAE